MEIKNIDRVLLIISIAIFIVILIFKAFSIKSTSGDYVSSGEVKEKIERDVNLEVESNINTTNTINVESKGSSEKGPYPPFVEFIE
ncbi:hypothetical protein [Dictyoglomus thermophilum]|uniref:Uncharacterized protein n=1 Tax=Dictyoglomus thermophilum (strain ATCC 35947 / DSM 3960 / H-6-12) TaxID=309799 RepID=B5YEE5_DICT6|nr:hypothetical protein [Dictyoglomus thermophilum]ACI18461.1 hypothetical protein DICTH_1054 [Dictyoglomus thermophilum H-6-12]